MGMEVDDNADASERRIAVEGRGVGANTTGVSENAVAAASSGAGEGAGAGAAAREARATAELLGRYKAAVMRAVPCVYDDYFKLEEDRVCAPFPASHVQMGTIVGGKGGTWWRANPRISGGLMWKEIVATEGVHCHTMAKQMVTDKKGRTLAVDVAITDDILL